MAARLLKAIKLIVVQFGSNGLQEGTIGALWVIHLFGGPYRSFRNVDGQAAFGPCPLKGDPYVDHGFRGSSKCGRIEGHCNFIVSIKLPTGKEIKNQADTDHSIEC